MKQHFCIQTEGGILVRVPCSPVIYPGPALPAAGRRAPHSGMTASLEYRWLPLSTLVGFILGLIVPQLLYHITPGDPHHFHDTRC